MYGDNLLIPGGLGIPGRFVKEALGQFDPLSKVTPLDRLSDQ